MDNASAPGVPDYTGLAERTAASAKAATDAQTLANRPNQTDPYGNTSTWTQDPTTGAWTNKVAFGASGQEQVDQTNAMRSGLLGQAANSLGKPMDMSGLTSNGSYNMGALPPGADPSQLNGGAMGQLQGNYGPMGSVGGAGQFSMDPYGNSKAIQDATMGLLQPQRTMDRNSELQRLKNQGLTEDSPAFQRAMLRQGQADTDAQLKALLAGQTEYGNQFNRGLDANKTNFDQRLQQGEFDSKNQNQRYTQDLGQAEFNSKNQGQLFNQRESQQKLAEELRGNRFGEQGDVAKFQDDQRANQLKEREALRSQPLNDLKGLLGLTGPSTEFGKFGTATNSGGVDYLGAGANTSRDLLSAFNAAKAGDSSTLAGILGLGGDFLKSETGGKLMDKGIDYLTNLLGGNS